jgi:hypothetical protein
VIAQQTGVTTLGDPSRASAADRQARRASSQLQLIVAQSALLAPAHPAIAPLLGPGIVPLPARA